MVKVGTVIKNPQMKIIKYLKYPFPKDTASAQITEARFYGNVPGHLRSTEIGLTTVRWFYVVSICISLLFFVCLILYLVVGLVCLLVWFFLMVIKLGPSRMASD